MKPLYLTKEDKVTSLLAEINKNAVAHTITDVATLHAVTSDVENMLVESGLPKKHWRGIRVSYHPSGPGKAYSKVARHFITTSVVLEYRAKGWALISAARRDMWSDSKEHLAIFVSENALHTIRECATRKYTLLEGNPVCP